MKKAVVIGSGGVGSVAALCLDSSKQVEVTMIVRSDYDVVMERGYNFDSCDYGEIKGWRPAHVVKSVEDAAEFGPFDYIFVTTKFIPEVQKTEDLIKPVMSKGAMVVLLQNGLGNEEPVMEAYPDAYVVGGVSMIGATNYNAQISHVGADEVAFGTYDERPEAIAALKELCAIYSSTKSKGEYEPNLRRKRWLKLMYNSVYNTVCALTDLDTTEVWLSGICEHLCMLTIAEVRAICEAEIKEKLPEGIEDVYLYCDTGIYYAPSMQVDVRKGQVMELECILGNPLRIAKKLNVPAPNLQMIYLLLRGKQMKLLANRGTIKLPERGFDYKQTSPMYSTLPWTE